MTTNPQPQAWRMEGLRIWTGTGEPPFRGALEARDGVLVAIGPELPAPGPDVLRLPRPDRIALPGLIQGHVHLCQTLMRGLADGRPLHRWLRERIWPLEAAHDRDTVAASARLGIAEALLHGATTLVDMGTVHHNDEIAAAVASMGVRAILGKALMDTGEGVPEALRQPAAPALAEALALHARWDGSADGRVRVALAPRFTLSVSPELWRDLGAAARERDLLVHTHVSETPWENETCRARHGATPVAVLERWGVLEARTLLVHAIHLTDDDRARLRGRRAGIAHCPGSNARLGSGILDLAALLADDIPVALGSDGAACNDALSPLAEVRLAAQLQALRHGPGEVPASAVAAMATREAARAVGLAGEVGTLEVGRRADLALFAASDLGWEEDLPLETALVFSACGVRPREVYVDGRARVCDGRLVDEDLEEIRRRAAEARRRLLARVDREGDTWRFPRS
jgi:cytosine/adenosine deaminase-related metal-dependent hydrolase